MLVAISGFMEKHFETVEARHFNGRFSLSLERHASAQTSVLFFLLSLLQGTGTLTSDCNFSFFLHSRVERDLRDCKFPFLLDTVAYDVKVKLEANFTFKLILKDNHIMVSIEQSHIQKFIPCLAL